MNNWPELIFELEKNKNPFVLITLVKIIGSAPQNLGAKIILESDGKFVGTVGGGKIEAHCLNYAKNLLNGNLGFVYEEWNLQKDIGMTCGGVVGVSFEVRNFKSDFKIAVFGAGHVASAFIDVASKLNCQIKCIDPRSEWLDKIVKKSNVEILQVEKMDEIIDQLTDDYFVISLTMGHSYDRPILARALKRNFKFVGVIGSEQKAKVLKHELESIDQISKEKLAKLVCPVGEKFGTNDPYEIAISILAQLLKNRDSVTHQV